MHVHEIHINKFRHLENVRVGPFKQSCSQSDLVVLAGPNGGGKSSVLELLGFALSNAWSLTWQLRRSFPTYSFEVALALTPDERRLVRQYVEDGHGTFSDDVLDYLDHNGLYYRAYNFGEGEYQKQAPLQNKIHSCVTNALKTYYGRSLGFFLKPDRHYPPEAFRRNTFFEGKSYDQRDYLWGMAFNTSDVQYQDMLEYLIFQRYHYLRRLGAYHHRIASSLPAIEKPADPLKPYDQLLQKLFPQYRFADADEEVPKNLFIQLPTGDVVPFSDLSSGEKEVFFILAFFLRHNVTNSMIVIDEPELHLHPEFARLLIRSMQTMTPGNQVWLATHNPEIIDEAGRDRVNYVTRNRETHACEITPGTEESDVIRRLKDLFGYSGYIGIARNIVFLEGNEASSDRRMFTAMFPEKGGRLKFIPCKSCDDLPRMNAAVLSILESNVGWMRFYLVRDRDFLTPEMVAKYREHSSGRMFVLERYHIENYLLDDELIAQVQTDIFGKATNGDRVRSQLTSVARQIAGEVLREMVAFRLNLIVRPQDFSMGRLLQGETVLDADGNWIPDKLRVFEEKVIETKESIAREVSALTATEAVKDTMTACQAEIKAAMDNSEGWRVLFPGRRLLQEYAKSEGLGKPVVLHNSLIKQLSSEPNRVPLELRNIMERILTEKDSE